MTELRTTGPDVLQTPVKKPQPKPGIIPEHRVPIYDHKKRLRGHVGHKATEVTVARFIGQHGAKLGKVEGRTAWIGPTPPPPKAPQADPTAVAVAKEQAKAPQQQSSESHKVEISVKQAMGSASKEKPDKPETRARPKR